MNESQAPPHAPTLAHAVIAGMDGGGTRTRLAIARGDGTLLGFAEGPCASFIELGTDAAARVMDELWRAAWAQSGEEPRPADTLFMGMGSILSQADIDTNRDLAASQGLAARENVQAANDAWNALAGGLPGRPGILLIAGTGSACLGRNQAGETWRSGGWGHLLGERGSAHALGFQALIAATRDTDGRGPSTSLTTMVREFLGLSEMAELYRRVHHDGISRADVAALAPKVVALAQRGDVAASEIVEDGLAGLIEMVTTVARRLSLPEPELALTGGLIEKNAYYRSAFLDHLQTALPGSRIAQDGLPPVFGALLLAYEAVAIAGAPPPSSLSQPSGQSSPPSPSSTASGTAFLAALRRSIQDLPPAPSP